MADRPTITTLASGAKYSTEDLNDNFTALRDAFDALVGINGTSGSNNAMTGDLDLDGNTLRNATFDGDIAGIEWKGAWAASTAYVVNDIVLTSGVVYICVTAHTSPGSFDTADGWEIFVPASAGVGDLISTNNLSDLTSASTARTNLGLVIGTDVLAPNGDGSSLTNLPNASIVGEVRMYAGTSAPTGWLFLNGDTVGSASSGATKASANYEDLFTLLWESMSNSEAAVSGGRGANAAADWAANKTITMPDARGRSVIGTGTGGGGLTARTHGDTGGAETHALIEAELPGHTHGAGSFLAATGGSHSHWTGLYNGGSTDAGYTSTGYSIAGNLNTDTHAGHTHPISGTSGSTGSGTAHANMQPWLALNFIIKW